MRYIYFVFSNNTKLCSYIYSMEGKTFKVLILDMKQSVNTSRIYMLVHIIFCNLFSRIQSQKSRKS